MNQLIVALIVGLLIFVLANFLNAPHWAAYLSGVLATFLIAMK